MNAYWIFVAAAAVGCIAMCWNARRQSPTASVFAARVLALLLTADAIVFVTTPIVRGDWSARYSLPLALCDVALIVAALACWWPDTSLLVELTYFWGLAGTLQAVATPDLTVHFPHLEFFEYTVGHLGIVIAALYLVVGLRRRPRPHAAARVFAITLAYTAVVGLLDWWLGADYMFLASKPPTTSLLSALGPWPWYVVSAAGVAVVLLTILDAPFWASRRRAAQSSMRSRPFSRSTARRSNIPFNTSGSWPSQASTSPTTRSGWRVR
jgi:hypothetical integral membrane protein (TIGR02206 family)